MNKQTAKHKWTFTSRFRAGAYGWKASRLAIQRIKEAVSEIKQVNRHDRLLAVEGAILFIEKLVPAIAEIDSSSLYWLSQGWGYEIDSSDVYAAYSLALEAGQKIGKLEMVKNDVAHVIEQDRLLKTNSSISMYAAPPCVPWLPW